MLKALDSLLFYVSNVTKTISFYKKLGFKVQMMTKGFGEASLGKFVLHFHDKNEVDQPEFRKEALAEPKGGGLYIYIGVDNINGYFKNLRKKKVKTSSQPRDWPWGNREFAVRDPDGYKLVFYEKIEGSKF